MGRGCRIYFDNPVATYYAGDAVTGKVVVETGNQEKIRYISARFRGEANVKWIESERETDNEGHTRDINVDYTAHEDYFEATYYLVGGPNMEFRLPPGAHTYNFSTTLPPYLPSSFEGEHGHIRYTLEVKINHPWSTDSKAKAFFTVLSHLDLNKDPFLKEPVSKVAEKTLCCCCCRSGPLTLVANVPATGFVCGQDIPITVEVDNGTNENIKNIICSLKKNICFRAGFPKRATKETTEKVMTIDFEPVGINDSKTWTKTLRIPVLPPSSLNICKIIDIDYVLDVKAEIAGPHINMHLSIPITLGTIPLLTYVPSGLSGIVSNPAVQSPQIPAVHTYPAKNPQPVIPSAPYLPSQSQYATAPLLPHPASAMAPTTSQLGHSDWRLSPPDQPDIFLAAPLASYPQVPPPSYEECVYGPNNSCDGNAVRHTQAEIMFVPRYPTYNLQAT